MRYLYFLYLMVCCLFIIPVFSQIPANPLLIHSNDPIPFDQVDAKMIREAVAQTMRVSDKRVKKIVAGA